MSNVIPLNGGIGLKYIVDDCGNNGISHNDWPVDLMKIGDNVCMIDKISGEITEEMESQVFNSVVYFWLLLDAPELFEHVKEH